MALHDILPPDQLACWKLFISACQIYCQSVISLVDIEKAREYLDGFFRSAESLYGPQFLTLNTHLHLYLPRIMVYATVSGYSVLKGIMAFLVILYQPAINVNEKIYWEQVYEITCSGIEAIPTDSHFLFHNFLTWSSGGTSNETLFGQNVSSKIVKIDTLIALPTSIVSASLEYIQNIPIKLLPPFILHKFDLNTTAHLKTSYMTFLSSINSLSFVVSINVPFGFQSAWTAPSVLVKII